MTFFQNHVENSKHGNTMYVSSVVTNERNRKKITGTTSGKTKVTTDDTDK